MSEPAGKQSVLIRANSDPAKVAEQRAEVLASSGGARLVQELTRDFSNWVDRNILKNPRAFFRGPRHPWHLLWVPDGQGINEHQANYREELIGMAYRPANLKDLEDQGLLVTGRDAALLAVSQESSFRKVMRDKGTPVPALPRELEDKLGFIIPPTVDLKGYAWYGMKRLYLVEREIVDMIYAEELKRAFRTNLVSEAEFFNKPDLSKRAGLEDVEDFIAGKLE